MPSADDSLPPKGPTLREIRDILSAYGDTLDFEFIRSELDTFTAADDPRRAQLETWIRQIRPKGQPE